MTEIIIASPAAAAEIQQKPNIPATIAIITQITNAFNTQQIGLE